MKNSEFSSGCNIQDRCYRDTKQSLAKDNSMDSRSRMFCLQLPMLNIGCLVVVAPCKAFITETSEKSTYTNKSVPKMFHCLPIRSKSGNSCSNTAAIGYDSRLTGSSCVGSEQANAIHSHRRRKVQHHNAASLYHGLILVHINLVSGKPLLCSSVVESDDCSRNSSDRIDRIAVRFRPKYDTFVQLSPTLSQFLTTMETLFKAIVKVHRKYTRSMSEQSQAHDNQERVPDPPAFGHR